MLLNHLSPKTRIDQQAYDVCGWDHRAEKLQPLAAQVSRKKVDAGGRSGPVHARDEACAHRVFADEKDKGKTRRSRSLGCSCGRISSPYDHRKGAVDGHSHEGSVA